MESMTDVQSLQQGPAQSNPPPADHSPSAVAGTTRPPPANNTIDLEARALIRQRKLELRKLSKTFGHIPNVPVFAHWKKRKECSASAVHRSIMAGIQGTSREGTYAVSLSGSYGDDEDGGDVVIYTGTGGRGRWTNTDPPKRLRVGPQFEDQSWDHPSNKALMVSFFTGKPLRLIRSSKCPSQYAPAEGYRYDGLYKVTAYWKAKGRSGMQICRCRLERLPDQPPIPIKPITMSTSRRRRGRLVTRPAPTSLSPCNPHGISDGINDGMTSNQPNTSTSVDSNTGESEPDVKCPPPPQQRTAPLPSNLTRYRWDPKNNVLVKITDPIVTPGNVDAAQGVQEEDRNGGDVTLVPSEAGNADKHMETEQISDTANQDEGHPLAMESQGDC